MGTNLQFRVRASCLQGAVVCGALLLMSASSPAFGQGGVAIEFSTPKSDLVVSNILEKGRSSGSVLDEIEDDAFSPLFRQDSSGSLGPVLTSPSRRVVVPTKRSKELQDERKNWLMMDPEDYLRRSIGTESGEFSDEERIGMDEAELTIAERYYLEMRERESRSKQRPSTSQGLPQGSSPFIGNESESGFMGDFNEFLGSEGKASNPLLNDLFPVDDSPVIASPFDGDGLVLDPQRLGGAFSPNLVGDTMRRSRLDSFQQLLRPDQELTAPLSSFQDLMTPTTSSLNPSLDQSTGLDPSLTTPDALNAGSSLSRTVKPLNQGDPFNSSFTQPDPFRIQALQDPNSRAFGQMSGSIEPTIEPRPRANFAPLVLPRPKRDF